MPARILLDTVNKSGHVVARVTCAPAVLSSAALPTPVAERQQKSITLFPHEDVVFDKM